MTNRQAKKFLHTLGEIDARMEHLAIKYERNPDGDISLLAYSIHHLAMIVRELMTSP
jgi:hypothetical protein